MVVQARMVGASVLLEYSISLHAIAAFGLIGAVCSCVRVAHTGRTDLQAPYNLSESG